MASRIIGRAKCPECGFESAHVKESDRCIYRYCPACGINGPHARTELQRRNMLATMRPEGAPKPAAPTPTEPTPREPEPAPPTPTATPTPTAPAAKPAKRGLFF